MGIARAGEKASETLGLYLLLGLLDISISANFDKPNYGLLYRCLKAYSVFYSRNGSALPLRRIQQEEQ